MEKKKQHAGLIVFLSLFIVGAAFWLTFNYITARRISLDSKMYGSPSQWIVMDFKADTRRDYWQLSYETDGYQQYSYSATIYMVDRCGYDTLMDSGIPQNYEILSFNLLDSGRMKPARLFDGNCDNQNELYIVWKITDGTVIVTYESTEVYFESLTWLIVYLFGGLALFGVLYYYVKNKNTIKKKHRKRKKQYCPKCGVKLLVVAEFCPHCGEIFEAPNENLIKLE